MKRWNGPRPAELDAVRIPLFEIEAVEWQAPDASGFDALLMTSANALRFGGEQLASFRGLPVHAVGKATAEAAREAGFDIASSGDGGVERLLGSLEADLKLLHLCGEDRSATRGVRQEVTAVTVYRIEDDRTGTGCPRGSGLDRDAPLAACRHGASLLSRKSSSSIGGTDCDPRHQQCRCASRRTRVGACEMADQPSDDALLALAGAAVRQAAAGMNATSYRRGTGWGARLAIGIALLLVGAAAATWALARYHDAARFLGVTPAAQPLQRIVVPQPHSQCSAGPSPPNLGRTKDRHARTAVGPRRKRNSAGARIGRPSRCVSRRLCRTPCDRPRPFTRISGAASGNPFRTPAPASRRDCDYCRAPAGPPQRPHHPI